MQTKQVDGLDAGAGEWQRVTLQGAFDGFKCRIGVRRNETGFACFTDP
ncbi:hypothetical protein HZS55_11080 [Halosimplex rubrum]|uniref:Uncharacterized protein n=1 Tax=Halosimplex rubrum TaxID=869889 RepID=A0A7D5T078_9EURY|nr:hypothetical protein [Halosimplex rubrum]QLH77808.1 hypothetical protein HZS55_11080 [Halosimplex rubrum]